MEFSALLTSAGINIALCILYLSLYSILRKQPHNFRVYFGRRLAEEKFREQVDYFSFERLLPTAGWLVKAYWCTEDEIRRVAGLDSVVFLRLFIFSIRIFSITTLICVFGVLPVNYNGQEMAHTRVPAESLNVFTIANLKEGSSKLWVHCTALYVITISACILLFQEYRYISRKRLAHITGSTPNPGHFAVLVRSIPKSHNELLDDTIRNFFLNYHGSSYLSHQMIYRKGKLQNFVSTVLMFSTLQNDRISMMHVHTSELVRFNFAALDSAERAYRKFVRVKLSAFDQNMRSSLNRCGLCGVQASSFELYRNKFVEAKKSDLTDPEVVEAQKDCPGAIVFFKTRYAAIVASQVLQSSNPMLWVTNLAPEPRDVYWSNLWIPYRQIWLRKIATLAASVFFMFVFIVPVAFVQSMMQLEQLKQMFPNLRGALKTSFCVRVVTGYLPSVVLLLSLYTVPPLMMRFSAIEGSISRSGRKTSACTKILIFNIWNVFFVNVLSGSVLNQLNVLTRPKDMPSMLAELVPKQATFFMTYVLTSGWFSLCSEILQILNVYYPKYEMGGKLWPIMHNTMVFSLVLTQIIALGVFTIKKAPISTGFTILLLIGTILFNEYCRQRFSRIFNSFSAQDFIELDREDEQSGRMREIHEHLLDAYCQSPPGSADEIPMEMIMEDPAQEASNSSQELCDTVQEVAGSIIQEHIEERHGSSSGRR
uniref:Putative membrane protein n=1 Tax=Aegilops tauschii TaxID=37682 RepID=R7WE63_AEGTA